MNTQTEEAAEKNARLHFNPDWNKVGFTACVICFKAGAEWQQSQLPEIEQEVKAVGDAEILKIAKKDLIKQGIWDMEYNVETDIKIWIAGYKAALQSQQNKMKDNSDFDRHVKTFYEEEPETALQPEAEQSDAVEFAWTDELVKEMLYAKLPLPDHYMGNVQKCLDEFKLFKNKQ